MKKVKDPKILKRPNTRSKKSSQAKGQKSESSLTPLPPSPAKEATLAPADLVPDELHADLEEDDSHRENGDFWEEDFPLSEEHQGEGGEFPVIEGEDFYQGQSLGNLHEGGQDHYLPVVRKADEVGPSKTTSGQTDPLALYLREISRYPLLSPDQEKALTKAFAETGDIEIAKKLVQANLRLVVKIAMEYRYAYHNILDLIQEGNIGLMKAVSKFDYQKGAKLSYYASWWIRSYILKFILDNFRLVKIGTTSEQKKLFYNLLREKNRLLGMGIRPETKLLSQNLGVSEKAVALMDLRLGQAGPETSLDKPLFDDGTKGTLVDTLQTEVPPMDEVLGDAQGLDILKEKLHDFLRTLKERDREIFEKRLLSEIPPSLQSIADEYGVSRERVRQIEERLIQKLKVYMSEFIR